MKRFVLIACFGLSACTQGQGPLAFLGNGLGGGDGAPTVSTPTDPADVGAPMSALRVAPPTSGATTEEAFDTTTAEQRVAAVAEAEQKVATSAALGETVASLGSPSDPGFWLETPLVSSVQQGSVEALANGKKVSLELRPIDGPATAGSRISLPALRVLEVGITGLHKLTVYAD